ncbi:MAG TPA: PhzF family phenazine biosynthesis protein [Candidatus Dormibacteraeota bacterium]
MKLAFRLVDVFTDRALTGNQLAVVLDAEPLDEVTMQALAREFNFSETTFVLPATQSGCDMRVRIFTPVYELPMAGHPTIGTAVVLRADGRIGERATFELGVGPTPVEVDGAGNAWMTQRAASFGPSVEDRAGLAAALTLAPEDVRSDLPAQVVSTGNSFLLLPLASEDALRRAKPNFANWDSIRRATEMEAVYCFAVRSDGRFRARMFVPALASGEDPATGSAAGPLGAYAARHLGIRSLVIEQGVEMGRPSLIQVEAGDNGPRVGGSAVVVASGSLELP